MYKRAKQGEFVALVCADLCRRSTIVINFQRLGYIDRHPDKIHISGHEKRALDYKYVKVILDEGEARDKKEKECEVAALAREEIIARTAPLNTAERKAADAKQRVEEDRRKQARAVNKKLGGKNRIQAKGTPMDITTMMAKQRQSTEEKKRDAMMNATQVDDDEPHGHEDNGQYDQGLFGNPSGDNEGDALPPIDPEDARDEYEDNGPGYEWEDEVVGQFEFVDEYE
jgi:hypothetical protein